MNKQLPLVSIIMATYNRAHLIEESIIAIKNQKYENWECLIIDDGSTDDTELKITDLINAEPRFNYLKRPGSYKKGLPGCRNFGLDEAKGEYIVFFDDDDIPHPQLLSLALRELINSNHDFCRYLRKIFFGSFKNDFEEIEEYSSKMLGITDVEDIVMNKLPLNSCQVVWRKASIGISRFEETLMFAEEWEFYSRILSEGLTGTSINKVLYYGRKHPNSNTGEFQKRDPIRVDSQRKAALLVIQTLKSERLFSDTLKKYFIRMGFEIKSYTIIKLSLKAAKAGLLEKWKYKIGYQLYPVLKPIFYLKGKIVKS